MSTIAATIAATLRAESRRYDPNSQVAPAAVLWPDPDGLWSTAIPGLRKFVRILSLGDYQPEDTTGPAIWIRAQIDIETANFGNTADSDPIVVYLPHVDHKTFTQPATLSRELAPLLELSHRSNVWKQSNGRCWTPVSFLNTKEGLGLDVAKDAETRDAITAALPQLLELEVASTHRHVDAPWLRTLVIPDAAHHLLAWIDGSTPLLSMSPNEQSVFVAECRSTYSFDPCHQSGIDAARLLGLRSEGWANVWERFADAYDGTRYAGVADQLAKARPEAVQGELFADDGSYPDSWPTKNQESETTLRAELLGTAKAGTNVGRRLLALNTEHSSRKKTVWGKAGQAPLSHAVGHLASLVSASMKIPSFDSASAWADWYASEGHRIDDHMVRAVAAATSVPDREAILAASGPIYDRWADDVARGFQDVCVSKGYPGQTGLEATPGTVVVFVDGLRYDVGARLAARADRAGLLTDLTHRLAAYPSVTPTGQPAVAPFTVGLKIDAAEGFCASDAEGRALSGAPFHQALKSSGVQRLTAAETGDITGVSWTQTGDLDVIGHSQGHKLVDRIDAELDLVLDRVRELLDAGWHRAMVVTDHGWLLPANTARKVELPLAAVDSGYRKPRVARLRAGSSIDGLPTVGGTWDGDVPFASAPGTAAFEAGMRYDHGGLSPQECVIPVITITAALPSVADTLRIATTHWIGMRCRINISPPLPGITIELRTVSGDSTSRIGGPVATNVDGEAKALVSDPDLEGAQAQVVALDISGTVIAQREVTVGENL